MYHTSLKNGILSFARTRDYIWPETEVGRTGPGIFDRRNPVKIKDYFIDSDLIS